MKSKQALFEALDWGLFSFGMIVSAFLLPANIAITLFLQHPLPAGVLSSFALIPLVKLYLFLLLGGASWAAVHRIRFILFGLGLSDYRKGVTVLLMTGLGFILVAAARIIFVL